MKKLFNLRLLLILISLSTVVGCKEEQDLQLGEPFSKLDGINDTWILASIVQIDGLATDPTKRQLDLPEDFIGDSPMSITFDSTAGTYSVQSGNTILNLLGDSGTWSFDDDNYPTSISFNGTVWNLLAPTRRVDNTLKISTAHYCTIVDDTGAQVPAATVSYIYTFERQE